MFPPEVNIVLDHLFHLLSLKITIRNLHYITQCPGLLHSIICLLVKSIKKNAWCLHLTPDLHFFSSPRRAGDHLDGSTAGTANLCSWGPSATEMEYSSYLWPLFSLLCRQTKQGAVQKLLFEKSPTKPVWNWRVKITVKYFSEKARLFT